MWKYVCGQYVKPAKEDAAYATWLENGKNAKSDVILSRYQSSISPSELKQIKCCETSRFAQRPGMECEETFAPVARMSSVWLLIALATLYDTKIEQFVVKTAYLNGDVYKDIYMEPPKLLK